MAQPADLHLTSVKSKEVKMKRLVLISLICLLAVTMSASLSAAKSKPGLPAPESLICTTDEDSVLFAWSGVEGATKYSIDAEVIISEDPLVTVELSFSSDGANTSLDVSFTEFVDPVTGDQLSGSATAKVKALNPPGKKLKSQNNPFSPFCAFTLPGPAADPEPETETVR